MLGGNSASKELSKRQQRSFYASRAIFKSTLSGKRGNQLLQQNILTVHCNSEIGKLSSLTGL